MRAAGIAEADAIRLAALDIKDEGASAPALVGLCWPQGTRAEHLAATGFQHLSRHVPRHEIPSFLVRVPV